MGNIFSRKKRSVQKSLIASPAHISDETLDTVVANFLRSPGHNNAFIPDIIERRLYKNSLKLAMNLLVALLINSKVELLGHQLQFSMVPIQQQTHKDGTACHEHDGIELPGPPQGPPSTQA